MDYPDLLETFDDIDPAELISQDPSLESIANEVLHEWGLLGNAGFLDVAQKSPASSTSSSQDSENCDVPAKPRSQLVCSVCGAPSRGYRSYGATVCNSCKAFFSRATKGSAYENFLCVNGLDNCQTDSKSWLSCQKCRFEQCIQSGMRPPGQKTSSLLDQQAKRRDLRWRFGREIVRRLAKHFQSITNISACERQGVERVTTVHMETGARIIARLVCFNQDIFRQVLNFLVHGRSRNPFYVHKVADDYMAYYGRKIYMQDKALLLDGIKQKDRLRLIAANFPLITEFMIANKLGKVTGAEFQLLKQIKRCTAELEQKDCEKAERIFDEVTKNGRVKPMPIAYDNAFDVEHLGLMTPDARRRHKTAAFKMSQLELGGGPCDWDPIVCSLTACIIMFTPDFVDLDEPKVVEDAQASFAALLQRYLRSREFVNREAIFRNSILASSYARELREFRDNAINKPFV